MSNRTHLGALVAQTAHPRTRRQLLLDVVVADERAVSLRAQRDLHHVAEARARAHGVARLASRQEAERVRGEIGVHARRAYEAEELQVVLAMVWRARGLRALYDSGVIVHLHQCTIVVKQRIRRKSAEQRQEI